MVEQNYYHLQWLAPLLIWEIASTTPKVNQRVRLERWKQANARDHTTRGKNKLEICLHAMRSALVSRSSDCNALCIRNFFGDARQTMV